MVTRAQFRNLQTARGLSTDVIIQRTGILPQSLLVLFSTAENEGLDHNKLISQSTLDRVMLLIGLETTDFKLRKGPLIEWRSANGKAREEWKSAVKSLRPQLFSTDIEMSVVSRPVKLWSQKKMIIFLYDSKENLRIAVTHADTKIKLFLESIFGVTALRDTEAPSQKDFDLTQQLINNGVFRPSQFDLAISGRKARYTWEHVQAAAQEFGFENEELINMIVASTQKTKQEQENSIIVQPEQRLRAVGL